MLHSLRTAEKRNPQRYCVFSIKQTTEEKQEKKNNK